MRGPTPRNGFTPGARVPVETTLRVCRCGAGQVVLRGGLTPASGRAGSVAPGEGLPQRPRSATGFDCSGLPGGCEGLRALLPPVLDQEASGRGQEPRLGRLSKKTSALQGPRLPAQCLEASATVRTFGWYVSWAGRAPRASPRQSEQVSPGRCRVGFCASAEPAASCRSLRSQHGHLLPASGLQMPRPVQEMP